MTFSINHLPKNIIPSTHLDAQFRQFIEDILEELKVRTDNNVHQLEGNKAYRFSGNFYGLLTDMNIPAEYHWITLRMNGFTSPYDIAKEQSSIIVPNLSVIDNYVVRYKKRGE